MIPASQNYPIVLTNFPVNIKQYQILNNLSLIKLLISYLTL